MSKRNQLGWGMKGILMAAFMCVMYSSQADASVINGANALGGRLHNEWVDENLGPGVAKWVDENGNVTEKPKAGESQTQENQTGGQQGESQPAAETEPEIQPEIQPETQPEAQPETQPEEQPQSGRKIDPSKPMIALTFDDGPLASVGNQIMDSLAQYNGKATFFVVGNRVPSYASEMKRMVAEGHEIGNHTYEHKYLTKLNASQIQYQINKCNDVVESVCGVRPTLVRLPGGLKNNTVIANINAPIIMWNIDTRDWETRNTQKTINAVIGKVHDGDIVLMHELYSQTGAAAVQIIPQLVEQGYQLVTVSELAQYRGGVQSGHIYNSFRP